MYSMPLRSGLTLLLVLPKPWALSTVESNQLQLLDPQHSGPKNLLIVSLKLPFSLLVVLQIHNPFGAKHNSHSLELETKLFCVEQPWLVTLHPQLLSMNGIVLCVSLTRM